MGAMARISPWGWKGRRLGAVDLVISNIVYQSMVLETREGKFAVRYLLQVAILCHAWCLVLGLRTSLRVAHSHGTVLLLLAKPIGSAKSRSPGLVDAAESSMTCR